MGSDDTRDMDTRTTDTLDSAVLLWEEVALALVPLAASLALDSQSQARTVCLAMNSQVLVSLSIEKHKDAAKSIHILGV